MEIRSNDIIEYVKGFGGIEIMEIEGNDFIQSYYAIQAGFSIMRNERRPFLILADVPLLNHHTSGVRMEWYRDDLEAHGEKDPLPILNNQLKKNGIDSSLIKKNEPYFLINFKNLFRVVTNRKPDVFYHITTHHYWVFYALFPSFGKKVSIMDQNVNQTQ